jgi:uncharacterized damage-inducible protein DinB
MIDIAQTFLDKSRDLLLSDYLPKIECCLERLSDEDLWWRPNAVSNSIGNLVLHLCGNITQWVIGGVGGTDVRRDRQREFDERGPLPGAEMQGRIRAVIGEAAEVIAGVDVASLLTRRHIQGYDVTALEAIYHAVEHCSMHTGQIILITKMRTGEDLRLWEPPAASTPA